MPWRFTKDASEPRLQRPGPSEYLAAVGLVATMCDGSNALCVRHVFAPFCNTSSHPICPACAKLAAFKLQPERPVMRIFYSYSREDESLRNELENHLSSLKLSGVISEWHDRKILAGEDRKSVV